MHHLIIRQGRQEDIAGVLELQSKYLYANLTEEQRKKGFVTTPFTIGQIIDIIAEGGLFLALDQEEVVAYIYAGSWTYFQQWPIFSYMIARLPQLNFNDKIITVDNSFQYGPICIAEAYRGQGLINKLFEAMRIVFSLKYPISMTFINKVNVISERAHTQKLGWEIIDNFEFNNNHYLGLAFDMTTSVV